MNINGVLFLLITNMTFSNMFAVINVFCLELPIFLREHFNGMYRTDTYFICRQLAELPIFLFLPLVFLAIIYYMVGLNAPFVKFAITVAIIELMTQAVASFGEAASSFKKRFARLRLPNILHRNLHRYGFGTRPSFPHPADALWRPLPQQRQHPRLLHLGQIPLLVLLHVRNLILTLGVDFSHRNELLAINQWDGIEGVSTACPTDPSQECPVSGDQILSNLNFDKVATGP